MTDDAELLAVFRGEVGEQVEALQAACAEPPASWDLSALFRTAHNVKGAARMVGASTLEHASHALEDLFSLLREGVEAGPELVALARRGVALMRGGFDALGGGTAPDHAPFRAAVDDEIARHAGPRSDAAAPQGPRETRRPSVAPREPELGDETIRVSADKLSQLTELGVQLASAVTKLEAHAAAAGEAQGAAERARPLAVSGAARDAFEGLRRAMHALKQGLTDTRFRLEELARQSDRVFRELRMVPVRSIGGVLGRVVADAAREAGKEARLSIEGGETEIDRLALQRLRDPLVHIVRNAIVHGIEPPDERMAAGKRPVGAVRLSARSVGGMVSLEVRDDGRGVDRALVRRRALAGGFVDADQTERLSDEMVLDLLFAPGFSSVEAADSLAGRGVGLDVVRQNVGSLGGQVQIDSVHGQGTTFALRVPLTRLTTRVVVLRLGDSLFALPAAHLERTVMLDQDALGRDPGGGAVADLEGEQAPVVDLASWLEVQGDGRPIRPGLVLRGRRGPRVFAVDEVLGVEQVLIHALGWNLLRVRGLMGSCILGHDTLAAVLDAQALTDSQRTRERARWRRPDAPPRVRRVLVCDDSLTSRTLEKNILEAAGYAVTTAIDGEKGWAELERAQREGVPFDVAVLDVEMPRLTGLELTRRIRQHPAHARLPVILVTSLGSPSQRRKGAEAGANAYIVKGEFDQDELLAQVERWA